MEQMKILLVDDEKTFIDNIASLLARRNYQAKAVYSGQEAVDAMKSEESDVVVLDLKMPGMDGMTTMKEIRKLNKTSEFLMLTGHGSIDTALEAVKLGAHDYLAKPCEIDELMEKIEEIAIKRKEKNKKKSLFALKGKGK